MPERGPSGAIGRTGGIGLATRSIGIASRGGFEGRGQIPSISSNFSFRIASECASPKVLTVKSGIVQNASLSPKSPDSPTNKISFYSMRRTEAPVERRSAQRRSANEVRLKSAFPGTNPFVPEVPSVDRARPLTSDGLKNLLSQPNYGTSESLPKPIDTSVRVLPVVDKPNRPIQSTVTQHEFQSYEKGFYNDNKKDTIRKELQKITVQATVQQNAVTVDIPKALTITKEQQSVYMAASAKRKLQDSASWKNLAIARQLQAKGILNETNNNEEEVLTTNPNDGDTLKFAWGRLVTINDLNSINTWKKHFNIGSINLVDLEKEQKKKFNFQKVETTLTAVANPNVELSKPDQLIQTASQTTQQQDVDTSIPSRSQETVSTAIVGENAVAVSQNLEVSSKTSKEIIIVALNKQGQEGIEEPEFVFDPQAQQARSAVGDRSINNADTGTGIIKGQDVAVGMGQNANENVISRILIDLGLKDSKGDGSYEKLTELFVTAGEMTKSVARKLLAEGLKRFPAVLKGKAGKRASKEQVELVLHPKRDRENLALAA